MIQIFYFETLNLLKLWTTFAIFDIPLLQEIFFYETNIMITFKNFLKVLIFKRELLKNDTLGKKKKIIKFLLWTTNIVISERNDNMA